MKWRLKADRIEHIEDCHIKSFNGARSILKGIGFQKIDYVAFSFQSVLLYKWNIIVLDKLNAIVSHIFDH